MVDNMERVVKKGKVIHTTHTDEQYKSFIDAGYKDYKPKKEESKKE